MMKTYLYQLQEMASPTGIELVKFFELANIPTSTYYRAIKGTDLRLATAEKVEDAIRVYALHQAEESARRVV
mgnify:FL=1